MGVAEVLKKIRMKLCFSQKEFADELKVTRSSISCYERGVRQPSFPTIRKIMSLAAANGIEVTLEELHKE